MPDELPTPVTWATKIWLKEALYNLMLASDCIVMQSEEEGRELIVALGRCPDTPAEKTSADKAQDMWMLRSLQQNSYVSHIVQEICDDSTKGGWPICSYQEYCKLLEAEKIALARRVGPSPP